MSNPGNFIDEGERVVKLQPAEQGLRPLICHNGICKEIGKANEA